MPTSSFDKDIVISEEVAKKLADMLEDKKIENYEDKELIKSIEESDEVLKQLFLHKKVLGRKLLERIRNYPK